MVQVLPVERLRAFIASESAGGIVLIVAAAIALAIANSPLLGGYQALLSTPVIFSAGDLVAIDKPLLLWINDGLMALFFFLIGLEVKREIVTGQLQTWRDASLPVYAALGGMILPALVFVAINWSSPDNIRGWAIPAATDIAFALGLLALLGSRVPPALKALLLAIAIIDDIGAIAIIALYGMLADRTEAIALRQQALDDRDRAQAASRAKADFLAHMSHELRTPMNGVIGFTDLLLADDDLPQKVREKLGLIAESGRAMNQILGDILDLSKIEAGELSLTSETVDTRDAVAQVIRSLDVTARTKGFVLASHVADDVPKHIEGDGLRLRQILVNLVGNAIKFTPTGTVAVSVRQRDNAIAFSVRDTGLGIPADRLDAIFGDFTQGDESVTRRFGGTGLGLAISRRLARQMGGTLKVRSVEGRGSTFTLTLPCRETTVMERPHRAAVPGHSARSYRPLVLLAEDHDINRMLVEEMAEALGIELVSVKDGLEAGQAVDDARAAGRPFDLVLMDLQMPRVTGIEATRAIRASGLSPTDLPILALTANAFQDDIAAARDAGMQAHLAKPITLEVLQRGLNRWLPRRAQDGARKRKVAA